MESEETVARRRIDIIRRGGQSASADFIVVYAPVVVAASVYRAANVQGPPGQRPSQSQQRAAKPPPRQGASKTRDGEEPQHSDDTYPGTVAYTCPGYPVSAGGLGAVKPIPHDQPREHADHAWVQAPPDAGADADQCRGCNSVRIQWHHHHQGRCGRCTLVQCRRGREFTSAKGTQWESDPRPNARSRGRCGRKQCCL